MTGPLDDPDQIPMPIAVQPVCRRDGCDEEPAVGRWFCPPHQYEADVASLDFLVRRDQSGGGI